MERPNVSVMDELEALLQDLAEMEGAICALKQRLAEIPARMATQLPGETERIAAARYLYWHVDELPTAAIAEGLLGVSSRELLRRIGPSSESVPCSRCTQPIQYQSRSHRQEVVSSLGDGGQVRRNRYVGSRAVLCNPCWQQDQEERVAHSQQQHSQRERRLQELRRMPYQEYLKTPEWQERRQRHLRSANYRCQICNTGGVVLNVHHRTYERRGEELFKDLVTLCQNCHDLFHREGRIAT